MSKTPIKPIGDGEFFSMDLLHEAAQLAHDDPEKLTDLHLRHVAVYDPGQAIAWEKKRARTLDEWDRQRILTETRATAAPETNATGTPKCPASAALKMPSDTSAPFNRMPSRRALEIVWPRTAFAVHSLA